jgi:hypothetical protein
MTQDERTAWSKPVNLTAALAGEPPPEPRIGQWTDVVDGKATVRALFYPNEVHSVGGEPESMKSWLLLHTAAQEVKLGHHVLYLDMEANDRSIVDRLRLLGAKSVKIKKHFHYFRPEGHISDADRARFHWWVRQRQPTLVVLDGVTEAYAMHGLSINSAEDAAYWFQNFGRQFQIKPGPGYDGPAIVELDHVVKDKDSRGGWTLGTQHKKAGLKGAMYLIEPRRPLGKGKHGISRLLVSKDSPGGVEWVPLGKSRQRYVGDFHVDATDADDIEAWIESADPHAAAPADGEDVALDQRAEFRQCMRAIWEFVAGTPGVSGKVIRAKVKGYGDKTKQTAIAVLEADGHLINKGSVNFAKWVVGSEFKVLASITGGGDEGAK